MYQLLNVSKRLQKILLLHEAIDQNSEIREMSESY